MDEEQSKKLYTEYRALGEQVKQMKEFLEESDDNVEGLNTTIEALLDLEKLEPGQKTFAPIANGIFIEATLNETKHLHMNVGDGTVVKKSVTEAVKVLKKQHEQLERMKNQAQDEYANVVARMRAIEKLVG